MAIVGVNHAASCVGYEGTREFVTDGRKNKHPSQEAAESIERLNRLARDAFDEFLILPYIATNAPPFRFDWIDEEECKAQYAAVLTRVSIQYESRF